MSAIKVKDKVQHIEFGTWLLVVHIYEDGTLLCRKRDLNTISIFEWEVKLLSSRKI